jgi:hypothetical protein
VGGTRSTRGGEGKCMQGSWVNLKKRRLEDLGVDNSKYVLHEMGVVVSVGFI